MTEPEAPAILLTAAPYKITVKIRYTKFWQKTYRQTTTGARMRAILKVDLARDMIASYKYNCIFQKQTNERDKIAMQKFSRSNPKQINKISDLQQPTRVTPF